MLTEVVDGAIHAGQVWTYRTRVGEESSRVVVGRVDRLKSGELIVHVALIGVRIVNPNTQSGVQSVLAHVPISEDAFTQSVIQLTDEEVTVEGFAAGYDAWRQAFESEGGGYFTVPLQKVPNLIEAALRGSAPNPPMEPSSSASG